jgi:hypothetical protein
MTTCRKVQEFLTSALTKEEWTRGPGTLPALKGLVWYTDGDKTPMGARAGICGQSVGRRLTISLGK